MDSISSFVMLFSISLAILLGKQVSTEILGLALTYIVTLSGLLQWTMRQSAEFENTMTAVERNMEYTRLEQEPPRVSEGGGKAPDGWPTEGSIEYVSMFASYRPGLKPVLKDLNFHIPGGSSVGIVGRTGSGKSSLLLTLFRLIDVNEGEIRIDGVNTANMGIDLLRKQLAVIPQDPVLFGGTLRSNLDPWDEQNDAQIWEVLRKVCMDSAASDVGGLDAPIAENGNNLSVGQRQLLCLARALLSDAKILALDEATANVDRATDALIQKSLHSIITQNEKTLLIIAHRIDTVMDCDLLLVLQNGELVEFDSPQSLLSRRHGVFAGMVEAAKRASSTNPEMRI